MQGLTAVQEKHSWDWQISLRLSQSSKWTHLGADQTDWVRDQGGDKSLSWLHSDADEWRADRSTDGAPWLTLQDRVGVVRGRKWLVSGWVCVWESGCFSEYDPLTSFKSQTPHCVIQTLACAFIALIKDITQTHSKPVSRLLSSSSDGTNFESFGIWNFRVSLRSSAALQNRKWGRLDVCQSSWQKKATLPKDLPSVHCEG